jgi:hypothetical protein
VHEDKSSSNKSVDITPGFDITALYDYTAGMYFNDFVTLIPNEIFIKDI